MGAWKLIKFHDAYCTVLYCAVLYCTVLYKLHAGLPIIMYNYTWTCTVQHDQLPSNTKGLQCIKLTGNKRYLL